MVTMIPLENSRIRRPGQDCDPNFIVGLLRPLIWTRVWAKFRPKKCHWPLYSGDMLMGFFSSEVGVSRYES
jgi:hypothetical protein